MATIDTDEKFRLAIINLIEKGQLNVQGERFLDAFARKVFDERKGSVIDITPDNATLESALDNALLELENSKNKEKQNDNDIKAFKAIADTFDATDPKHLIALAKAISRIL